MGEEIKFKNKKEMNTVDLVKEEPFEPFIKEKYTIDYDHEIDFFNISFKEKLNVSNRIVKEAYNTLRNQMNRYSLVRTIGCTYEEYYISDKIIFRFSIINRAIRIYINLKKDEVKACYGLSKIISYKGYSDSQYLLVCNSQKTINTALEILDYLMKKNKRYESDESFVDYLSLITFVSPKKLLDTTYKGEFLTSATLDNIDCLSDEEAKSSLVEEEDVCDINMSSIGTITIGELSAAFNSSYVIDLPLLKEIGLVNKNTTYLKIVNGGKCSKVLNIRANDYDISALKMIILCGGNATKLI